MISSCSLGFWILGATTEERRLVDAAAVFSAYASCDERAAVDREAYLSAFQFGEDFRQLLESTGSTKGFAGLCWSPFVWWDIDREDDLERALSDARRLAGFILARFTALDDDDLLLFYSGSKGFHVGIPSALWAPSPLVDFNRLARRFAEHIAELAGVSLDSGVYDKVRAFRAPNSKHPKTGRHKRRLTLDELTGLSLDGILQLAEKPGPFDLPAPTGLSDQAAADWRDAERWVREQAEVKAQRRIASNGSPSLNRSTFAFITDGATEGDRHRLLFSAAANLAEFGCPSALAHALLSPAALDSGLSPSDVRRQIDCGLAHGANGQSTPDPSTAPPSTASPSMSDPASDAANIRNQLALLWASSAPPFSGPREPADPVHGDAFEPPEDRIGVHPSPMPPADAQFYFQDDRCRPCPAEHATMWTWTGAPRWFAVADYPIPSAPKGGEQ